MFQLSQRDIKQGYAGVKHLAVNCVRKKDYTHALQYVHICADLAGQFNWIYCDNQLESILQTIAKNTITTTNSYKAEKNRWVLYDDWCTSYVLAVQWLEAMANTGNEILYITSRDFSKVNRNKSILDRAEVFPNVKVHIVKDGDAFERSQDVYDVIVDFRASKVVLHKSANISPVTTALYVLPKEITTYLINLSDQTFWLGARAIDYCLEFRQFGASVSLQRRGLKKDQLLLVPFYPADDRNPFGGFPEECTKDKVIIFSGGDYYKTLNEKRTYWRLVKRILDTYPQVVFLFATKNIPEGDAEIYQFIRDNHFEGRFIYINFRPDIYQVFAHCDIYMGTSPTSGSLMSGLAAVNGKPILQYYEPNTPDDETEQALCYNEQFRISFDNEDDFMQEADRLITNAEYRHKQGRRLNSAIISPAQFEQLVADTLTTNQTQREINAYSMDYRGLDDRWYYLEKAGYTHTLSYLYGILGFWNSLFWASGIFFKKNMGRLINKLKRSK